MLRPSVMESSSKIGASPIAKEAVDHIGALFVVEAAINDLSIAERWRRRQAESIPIAQSLTDWAEDTLPKL